MLLAINFLSGIFGGSSIETGKEDPLILLLAVRGFVTRHLQFVKLLAEMDGTHASDSVDTGVSTAAFTEINIRCVKCSVVSNNQAVQILDGMFHCTDDCVQRVFSVESYAVGTSESIANTCLDDIWLKSKRLFASTNITHELATKSGSNMIYRCCD